MKKSPIHVRGLALLIALALTAVLGASAVPAANASPALDEVFTPVESNEAAPGLSSSSGESRLCGYHTDFNRGDRIRYFTAYKAAFHMFKWEEPRIDQLGLVCDWVSYPAVDMYTSYSRWNESICSHEFYRIWRAPVKCVTNFWTGKVEAKYKTFRQKLYALESDL